MVRLSYLLSHAIVGSSLWFAVAGVRAAGNTTCASGQLDWYTNVVGETPCATYQRLRQICNPDYQVGQFRSLTPGDNCDDQLSSCCCNSVSWALSMLCMNCQYDTASGDVGIDAGTGGYGLYAGTCGKPLNKTLPTDIQTAVCNKEIKLDRNLYSLFWDTGACIYTKQTMSKDFAATNNNTFTHCNSTLKASAAASSSASASQTSLSPTSSSSGSPDTTASGSAAGGKSVAPIIGGAVGGALVAMALAALGVFFYRRSRRRRGPTPLDLSKEYTPSGGFVDDPSMGVVTPFSAASVQQSNSGYGGGQALSEEFALLPRGYTSPHGGEKAGPWDSSHSLASDAGERHEDGGPVPALQRSVSGRLPPAYRQSWDASDAGTSPVDAPEYAPPAPSEGRSGSVSTGTGTGSGVAGASRAPLHLHGDVKRPLPPPS
ncbi:uncharacterized protein TRAVEDRAFT_147693 [Trametes versicolor FP-101664 SS1]|uniref:uncharacterized protein n=1 Tax=Trametes versicolor (strain FP-101664) TaxID=717944 RepID=UPI00046241B6|nr:uncharacterized protein TRAVEDRAFT_147693 [Trametes versicolor FP-101664 SS1]EIW59608.1 hypothetical protein TRAVEDRAFT_147693 [Trametes versicolor FP-101664 SS1]